MMRKYGFCAALIGALLTAALVIGCIAPIDVNSGKGSSAQVNLGPAPAGMGWVQLNLGNETKPSARATFVPAGLTFANFLHYRLEFTAGGTTPGNNAIIDIAAGSVNATTGVLSPIALDVGDYTGVTATAYLTAGTTGTTAGGGSGGALPATPDPVAQGTYTGNFSVAGTGTGDIPLTGIVIPLKAIIDGDTTANTQGKLTWSVINGITGPHTTTAATVTIVPANVRSTVFGSAPGTALTPPADTVDLHSGTLVGTWTGNGTDVELDSGYYFVDLKVTADGLTATQTHLVHIYQNMTTPITGLSFTNARFGGFASAPPPTSFTWTDPDFNELPIDVDASGVASPAGDGSVDHPFLLSITANDVFVIFIKETDLSGYGTIHWEIEEGAVPVTAGLSAAVPTPPISPEGARLTITAGQGQFATDAAIGYYALIASGSKDGGTTPLYNATPIYIQIVN